MIFSLTLICLPLSVSAQTMEEKIRNLEATVEQLQQTLTKMRAEMEKSKEADMSEKGGVVRTDGENITLSTTGGGMKLKSDNGNSFRFGGRLQLDYDGIDDWNEVQWRRTRITAEGTVKKDWAYHLTINVSDEGIDEHRGTADINTGYHAEMGNLTGHLVYLTTMKKMPTMILILHTLVVSLPHLE